MSETREDTLTRQVTAVDEKGYVYLHLTLHPDEEIAAIRIWKTTVLVDKGSAHESALVHAFNIPFAPEWLLIHPTNPHHFLLIFEGLPRSCTQFDMIERIPEAGGFELRGIQRNKSDVYRLTLR